MSHAAIADCSIRRIITLLSFCGQDIADEFERAAMIEPVDPFEGRIFDGLERPPRRKRALLAALRLR